MRRRRNPVLPSRLEAGDVVGVISPSTPVDSREELEKGLETLRSFGLIPKLSKNALAVHRNYMAGKYEDRLEDLHAMFADPEVRGIFCTGGGYVSNQLLLDINWDLIRKNPKILVGYSDITTLLLAIWKKTNMVTFHGTAIEGWDAKDPCEQFTLEHFRSVLMDGALGAMPHLTKWTVLRPGCVQGRLLGGNLEILTAYLINAYAPKWDGAILFWEDTDETIERFDFHLTRLRVDGIFKKIRGMIVGKVSNLQPIEEEDGRGHDLGRAPSVEEMILEVTKDYTFPILYGADFGHVLPTLTLPLGARVLLDCPRGGREGNISILQKYLEEKK